MYQCANPGCRVPFSHTPAAMERDNIVFCRMDCWDEWRRHNPSNVVPFKSTEPRYALHDYYPGNRIKRH